MEYAWTLNNRSCMECVRNMHGKQKKRVWICMEYEWNMNGICMEHAWNTDGMCMEYVMEYEWNMHGISTEYEWNVLQYVH